MATIKGKLGEVRQGKRNFPAYFYRCVQCGSKFWLADVPEINEPELCRKCDKSATPFRRASNTGKRITRKSGGLG